MPASGKTSVGKKLAAILSLPYIDTDRLIEERAGMTVTEIFAVNGEEWFRDVETSVLGYASLSERVVSCGGGIVVKESNGRALKNKFFTVYLSASLATLAERLGDGNGRPLIAGDPAERTAKLLEERENLYEEYSAAKVSTDGKTTDEIAAEIAMLVRKRKN